MDISTEKLSHAAIVRAIGRLDAAGAPMVEASCRALIQEKPKYLLLDMAAVNYVSSAGLRSLLVLAKAMKAAGGTLVLCSLTPSVREVMCLSGFDNILTLAADRSAALRLMQ
ncbi:MAG TPA: STAS domain-containing protein [Candidatus Paceibacterota bacterium]|nr:STAS domain-containing protein [Verrucomicrobiota bacterium]HRY48443.1 STAS domain-containing protein [Candidatus Paceibacterota bacterium]HRZ99623.1 STAS domain-containing protein [Candidatus Paceibacterota bacterium]